jgi:hypothetical protein
MMDQERSSHTSGDLAKKPLERALVGIKGSYKFGSERTHDGASHPLRDLLVKYTPAITNIPPITREESRTSFNMSAPSRIALMGTKLMKTPALDGPIAFIPS